jgi:hypothetical protein
LQTAETESFTTRGGVMGFVNSRCDEFEALANEFVESLPYEAAFEVAYYEQASYLTERMAWAGREFTLYENEDGGVHVWVGPGEGDVRETGILVLVQQSDGKPEIAVVVWHDGIA